MFDGCYNVSKKFILSQIKHYLQMSSIKDNYKKGSVGQFLAENIKPEADVSIVSAYFTIYAYHKLKEELHIGLLSLHREDTMELRHG